MQSAESEKAKLIKMSEGPTQSMTLLLSLPILACVIAYNADPAAALKAFSSVKGGYIVTYSSTWQVLEPSLPTLYIVNFPPAQRVHAVTLPPRGASIAVVPPPDGVLDAEQWATRDLKPGMNRVSKGRIVLKRTATGEPLDVTEVEQTRGLPGSEFEEVNCYFTVSGRLFTGRLTYWKGDDRAEEYRQALHKVIESLELLRRPARKLRGWYERENSNLHLPPGFDPWASDPSVE